LAGVDELELAKVGRMSKAIARKVRASLTPNDKA
jgi:hypothetical protein